MSLNFKSFFYYSKIFLLLSFSFACNIVYSQSLISQLKELNLKRNRKEISQQDFEKQRKEIIKNSGVVIEKEIGSEKKPENNENKIGYCSGSNVNVRNGYGDNYKSFKVLFQLQKNDQVKILETKNDWLRIEQVNGKNENSEQWVLGRYITFETPNAKINEKVISKNENVNDAFSLHQIGSKFFNNGQFSQASDYFNKAILADPKFAVSHYFLGKCLYKNGNSDKAKEAFKRAYDLSPTLFDGSEPIQVGPIVKKTESSSYSSFSSSSSSNSSSNLSYNLSNSNDIERSRRDYQSLDSDQKKAFERDFLIQGLQQASPGMTREEADRQIRESGYDPFQR